MGLSEEIRRQLIESFKSEQGEHVQKINQGLLSLEKSSNSEANQALLKEIFREAHSLKGAARAVGMTTIESLGHGLEDVLLNAKEGRLTFSPELFDLLYQTLDAIELLTAQIETGNPTPPAKVLALLGQLEEAGRKGTEGSRGAGEQKATQSQNADLVTGLKPDFQTPSDSPPADETIRVSVSKLDALMAQFSELLGAKIRAEQRLVDIRQMQVAAAEWQSGWLALRGNYSRMLRHGAQDKLNNHSKDIGPLVNFMTYNQKQLRVLNAYTNSLYRELSNDTMRLSLIVDALQEEIKRVRMLPLATITTTFSRMVRDLAREEKKEIILTINGGETELDKRVLEQIKDPLIHLLRNAVDHGLEPPAERKRAGKPSAGHILLTASQQGNNVVITVGDDGRGLDLQAIQQSAARKGVLNLAEAEKLSKTETINLIFNSGLSTSKIITDISGRGVGLDVVRQKVEALQGTLAVDFEPGQSTTFTLTLPLTLASSRALLIQVGEQMLALPLTTVERMVHLDPSEITKLGGKEGMRYKGQPIALAWLADLLELPRSSEQTQLTIVIIGAAEKRMGLIVDQLVGEQEMVMKSLGKQLAKVKGIAGATILGSGQVVLVLHPADLIKLAEQTPTARPALAQPNGNHTLDKRKTILVVDDSITTRTLEKNILETAGYEVKLATNGEAALGMLASEGIPDLVVTDVKMPRLDGFGLTRRIKQEGRFADIPVILVTSLDSPADKARGIEVGADAYIVKSNFDQGNLLETIEQLV